MYLFVIVLKTQLTACSELKYILKPGHISRGTDYTTVRIHVNIILTNPVLYSRQLETRSWWVTDNYGILNRCSDTHYLYF